MSLVPLAPDDPALKAALVEADLPTDDLAAEGAAYLMWSGPEGPAFAGLVVLGDEALLRSVVVPTEARGKGLGGLVVAAVAEAAAQAGAKRLWLLTTTAARFFAAQGWAVVDRGAAPVSIAATRQFIATCPASATLMVRTLA